MGSMVFQALRGRLKKTGQITSYHVGDDGDYERGLSQVYTVYTTGQYSGTTTFDVAHYAAATIAFVNATSKITDTANGLVTFLTGDTILTNSALNPGPFTIATGGVAGEIVTTQALVDEAAGAVIKIYKQASISNNCVWDRRTGLMWLRNTTTGLKIGPASTGTLNWYDVATCFVLHPAAADLQMIAPATLRIVGGAGEVAIYTVGDVLDLTGFATAANNLPGYRVLSVTVNGADLDIVLDPVKNTLVSEAAAGARSILLVCRSTFAYCAACNAAAVGGWTDWRIPYDSELMSIRETEAPTAIPDAVAFPVWTTIAFNSSTSNPSGVATGYLAIGFGAGDSTVLSKSTAYRHTVLVRGGTP